MQCFLRVQGSKFTLLSDKQGIMNGDVGKISGFYLGSELEFVDESGDNDKSVRDSFANNEEVIYLAVDYEGITSKGVEVTYTVFYQCENLTIKGYAGSYAETYAKESGIPFEEISEEIKWAIQSQ